MINVKICTKNHVWPIFIHESVVQLDKLLSKDLFGSYKYITKVSALNFKCILQNLQKIFFVSFFNYPICLDDQVQRVLYTTIKELLLEADYWQVVWDSKSGLSPKIAATRSNFSIWSAFPKMFLPLSRKWYSDMIKIYRIIFLVTSVKAIW